MDQVKIGKFIAQRRKLKSMTQLQLAEQLGITDRAVSKWETGKAMPDSSCMLELCRLLDITATDLLFGEVVTMQNEASEAILLDMVKQKEASDKRLLFLEIVIGFLSVTFLLTLCFGCEIPFHTCWDCTDRCRLCGRPCRVYGRPTAGAGGRLLPMR